MVLNGYMVVVICIQIQPILTTYSSQYYWLKMASCIQIQPNLKFNISQNYWLEMATLMAISIQNNPNLNLAGWKWYLMAIFIVIQFNSIQFINLKDALYKTSNSAVQKINKEDIKVCDKFKK